MQKSTFIIAIIAIFLLTSCDSSTKSKENLQSIMNEKEQKIDNLKSIASKAQNALFTDYSADDVKTYFHPNYIQHNPYTPTGLEPILGFLPSLKKAKTVYKTHRLLQDGDFVIAHNTYDNAEAFGAKELVAFDIYRIENGKIAEHWDAVTPIVTETASGRSQTDGPTKVADLDKTSENKELIKNFIDDILMGKNPSKIQEYIQAENYHQHNTGIKDGLNGLNEAIAELVSENNMFTYHKVHRILGEGNFVLSQSEGEWNGGKKQAFYDLFRIEEGKIVEHWDVIQEIPSEMPHNNGMF